MYSAVYICAYIYIQYILFIIYLSIYLSIYPMLLSKVVSDHFSMAQCFSTVFVFLRGCPRKVLVTQKPDEGPQRACLLVGMAQR